MRNVNYKNSEKTIVSDAKTCFEITGTVQDTFDGKNAQYATFYQSNGKYYDRISVCIPNDIGTFVDIGDKVHIKGYVKSFYNKESGRANTVLTAKEITEMP